MNKPIITSLISTDLYKLSMMQAVFHQYPTAQVRYEFKCRNEDVDLVPIHADIDEEMKNWKNLRLTKEEADYLRSIPYFKDDFISYLENFRINTDYCSVQNINWKLHIEVNGPWLDTILFELLFLPVVNELYFRHQTKHMCDMERDALMQEGRNRLRAKVELANQYPGMKFAEFGTRRRFSGEWQDEVVGTLARYAKGLVGTSNVALAMKYGLTPIGTVAHEYFSASLGLTDLPREAQKRALHTWLQEYGTNLGIALSDTFTTDAFLQDFGPVLANGFDGVRHDSGCPFEFGEKIISHYKSLNIDPRLKTVVFSDGLDFQLSIDIWKHFVGRIGISFGIGTYLTNDLGLKPLNIVMKLLECNKVPCVKISDVWGKAIGDPDMIQRVKDAYGIIN